MNRQIELIPVDMDNRIGNYSTYDKHFANNFDIDQTCSIKVNGIKQNNIFIEIYDFNDIKKYSELNTLLDIIDVLHRQNTKYNMMGYSSIVYKVYYDNNIWAMFVGFANNFEECAPIIKLNRAVKQIKLRKVYLKNKPEEIVIPDNSILYINCNDFVHTKITNLENVKLIDASIFAYDKLIKTNKELTLNHCLVRLFQADIFNGLEKLTIGKDCKIHSIGGICDLKELVLNDKVEDLYISHDKLHRLVVYTPLDRLNINDSIFRLNDKITNTNMCTIVRI